MSGTLLVPPLRHPVARLLLAAFVVLHAALALASTGAAPRTLLALVLVCGAAAAVVLPGRLPVASTTAAMLGALVASGLVVATLPVTGWPGYAAWPLGATTFIALALALRGRLLAAWLLLAGLAVESVAWSLLAGAGPLPGFDLVVRHAGTLLLGTLFAVGLRRSAISLRAYREAERGREVLRAAAAAGGQEQRRVVEHVLALVEPTLADLAAGVGPDPGCLLALEGRMRDEVTAGPLLTGRLNRALAGARERGVDAVLLDDASTGPLGDRRREDVAEWIAARADRARTGRLVVRATRRGDVVRVSALAEDEPEVLELPIR